VVVTTADSKSYPPVLDVELVSPALEGPDGQYYGISGRTVSTLSAGMTIPIVKMRNVESVEKQIIRR
jgi:hypothetical protein